MSSNISVAARMAQKKLVKDFNGNIIDLKDEADGGWIIRNRQVVNQEKYNEMVQKQKDKQEAAKAAALAVSNPQAPNRNVTPKNSEDVADKIASIEKKVEAVTKDVADKFDSILKILNNKNA